MKKKLIGWLLLTLGAAVYAFVRSPNLNPLYHEGAFFWAVLITLYAGVSLAVDIGVHLSGGQVVIDGEEQRPHIGKGYIALFAAVWAAFILAGVLSTPLFNYKAYRDQMAEPEVREFSAEVQVLDMDQVPVVDKALASILADRKLGEKPSLGSQVYVGEPTIQDVDGELVWAVPLHHSGFFKWLVNMEGADGFIIVSATDPQDVRYVDDYKIRIQPNSYLLFDLHRRVRFSEALFSGIVDYSFELDDTGVPYWVVTTYKNRWIFSLPEADGVVTVNASTGESVRYSMDEVPEWVDRVQPEEFIMDQIANKGEYIKGIFNFSNSGKFRPSPGEIILYNGGKCYLFTGVTSVGVDQSTSGFYMVDMRTKEPIMYQISGATEQAAMASAEGKVQDLGYDSTFPLILNIDGNPTYFMTLKDNAGLIKKYSFVSVRDFMLVGEGDTMAAALGDYREALASSGPSLIVDNAAQQEKTGVVDRIASEVQNGTTVYFLTLQGDSAIYRANAELGAELSLTAPGDEVTLRFPEGEST
ncbi:MAG: hypothetical protein IKM31_04000, partial [Oscillospiraceae bacterium]|nr:hypothetical protein [Oscillospiraceae bacterium]